MTDYEVVVWKDDGRGWVRVGGPGPRAAMDAIWKAARDTAIAQGRKPEVWIRTAKRKNK